jgi:hypothetical protein
MVTAVGVAVLAAAPLSSASAHRYHDRSVGLGGALGAVVVGAATIASAPFVLLGVAPGPRFDRDHYRRERGYRERAYDEQPQASYPAPAPAYYGPPEQQRNYYGPPPRQTYAAPRAAYEAPCDRDVPPQEDYRESRAAAWNGYGY